MCGCVSMWVCECMCECECVCTKAMHAYQQLIIIEVQLYKNQFVVAV